MAYRTEINRYDDILNDKSRPMFYDLNSQQSITVPLTLIEFICTADSWPLDIGEMFAASSRDLYPVLLESQRRGLVSYLFVSDSYDIPDTRITRYYKLWKPRSLPFDVKDFSSEYLSETSDGLRFYGAVKLHEDNFATAMELLTYRSGIMIMSKTLDVESFSDMTAIFHALYQKHQDRTSLQQGRIHFGSAAIRLCPPCNVLITSYGEADERIACYKCVMPTSIANDFLI
jgi:hypothetical protein